MKKVLLFLYFLLLLSSMLYAEDELGMDEKERGWAEERLSLIARDFALEEQPEILFFSSEYEANALTFRFAGREYSVFYEPESRSSLNRAIDNALLYAYGKSEAPSVDYIYNGSFSSVSLSEARKGTTFAMKNSDGHMISLFEVSDHQEDITLLEPVYIGRAYANMPLERTAGIDMQLVVSSSIYPSIRPSVRFDISKRDILYPVNPFAGVLYIYPSGVFAVAGFSYTLRLGSFFRGMSFTMLQDAAITAKAAVVAGYFSGFSYGALWSVAYEHSLSSMFYWSVGMSPFAIIGGTTLSQYPVSLSLGVRL